MIDFYVQRQVLKAHTDCPAVSCHEGPALLLAAAEDRDACFVRFVRPSASLVKGVNGSKVIWFPAPTAAARFAFAHRRPPPCHVDPRVRGPGMLHNFRGIPKPDISSSAIAVVMGLRAEVFPLRASALRSEFQACTFVLGTVVQEIKVLIFWNSSAC